MCNKFLQTFIFAFIYHFMNPLVTVSIPLFKCEAFIEKTLRSVKNQSYSPIEVLLVNDVTPDQSAAIAEDFIRRHQLTNWRIINLKVNSGLSVVRNEGILQAQGDYLFFLDSDDELLPSGIEDLVKTALRTHAQITMGEVIGIRLPENEMVDVFPIREKRNFIEGTPEILHSFVNGNFPVSSWNKLIRRDFILQNKLWFTPGLYAQDSLHSFEMALKAESVAFLREKTYRYYLHSASVIHNRKKVHFDNWITIAQKIDAHYREEKDPERKKLILQYLIDFKAMTLQMNWKAQKNEALWKRSYTAYSKLISLSFLDYFSTKYSTDLKKKDLFISLPVNIGFPFFKWRYER